MIFITTGTVTFPFHRLIEAVIDYYIDRSGEKVIVQSGNYFPRRSAKHLHIQSFFSSQMMKKYYQSADLIISAAGEGSVLEILKYSKKKPILFPRLHQFGEHVDDQQLFTAQAVVRQKKAYMALDEKELFSLLQKKFFAQQLKVSQGQLRKEKIAHQTLIRRLHTLTKSL